MEQKIQQYHREKLAYVYLRQSTMGQVRLNRESTERQYALKNRAEALGWPRHRIKILDKDLGLSGSNAQHREDFKMLVADVSMSKVGAVFALEASRLSRSCTDWHRLLEICALTNTLILDEDGCYNPKDFNDQLLLGLKGTMSQAELHFIRARLIGGKINKAKKGELRHPLPVGYCYDEDGKTILDFDMQVQTVIALLFKTFKEKGSAYAVAHHFSKNNIEFPKRAYGGAWRGKLIWGKLSVSRILGVLKNPTYAGTYVYGRYQYEKSLSQEGELRTKMVQRDQNDWTVVIHDHHEGYITWDEYLMHQKQLKKNQTNGKDALLPGPVREGLSLLQGLLICSYCGHKITIRYQSSGKIRPYYLCSWRRKNGGPDTKDCLSIRCEPIDAAISERILAVIKPEQIQIAISALESLENRRDDINQQWQLKIERAQYDSDLAQRRYEEVDPSNRLVAATLEKRWNDALSTLDELRKQHSEHVNNNPLLDISARKEELFKLASDFPKLWHAESTTHKDRKRIVRLLIKDISIKISQNRETAILYIRWQGGAAEEMPVPLPKKSADLWRCSPETANRVRELALHMTDREIVNIFKKERLKTNKGNEYTLSSIQWIRYRHKIPSVNLRKTGELSVNEVAKKFNVSHHVVRYWIERHIITARKAGGHRLWISLTAEKEAELRQKVNNSSKIAKARADKFQKPTEGGAV